MGSKPDPTGVTAVSPDLNRREFVAASLATGLAGVGASAHASELPVTVSEVSIKTPDGNCDAAFFHPTTGKHPAVLIWPDAFGLRPSMREMGRRLAAEGFAVLVPNPFYRTDRAPQYSDVHSFNFNDPNDRQKLFSHMGTLNEAGNPEKDATAYVAWLDSQKEVSRSSRIGTQGYCMGGPLIMRTAAALPGRIGAAASFHGGGLVTDKPESPHLLIPKMKARLYIGIAANDDSQQPDAKLKLREAFDAAHVRAEIEVYPDSVHGWCMKDMPNQANGKPGYNEVDAERAWAKLLALYKATLG